jgi:RepB plasmid partitioning protein/ParB/Sulfiredoxin domain
MSGTAVKTAFQPSLVVLPIPCIVPLKEVPAALRRTSKYQQIATSLQHVGLIEPLVVFPIGKDQYWLLDGHVRLDILKGNQVGEVKCLLATDDETYNYNKRVNFLPAIAEHHMILKALANGVSEQRIAAALNVDVANIRKKRSLLDGICSEAAALLKEKRITGKALGVLRRMKPIRQIEAAELMIASNSFSTTFVKALLIGTKPEYLCEPLKPESKIDTAERETLMEEETAGLLKDLKAVEESYGTDILNLIVCCRYAAALLKNSGVKKYVDKQHPDILREMEQLLADVENDKATRRTLAVDTRRPVRKIS